MFPLTEHILGVLLPLAAFEMGAVYLIALIVGGGLVLISTLLGGGGHDADVELDADALSGADFSGDLSGDFSADFDADGLDAFDATGAADALDGADALDTADAFDAANTAGPDLDADHPTGFDHAHDSVFALSHWFSVRFLVYFAAMFGAVGTILNYTTSLSAVAVGVSAVVGGVVVGQGVHQLVRYLQRTGGGRKISTTDYLRQPARVTVSISPGGCGEVALRVAGSERYVAAKARRDDDAFKTGDEVVVVAYQSGTAQVCSRREYEFLNEASAGERS